MTKQEAIDFIYSSYLKAEKYISFDEKDAFRRSPDLLSAELNDRAFYGSTNIVVTGSKGKGSTSKLLSALFSGQNDVGLVLSPEVLDFTDRIQVVKSFMDSNGKIKANFSKIKDEDFISGILAIKSDIQKIDDLLPEDKYVSPVGIVALLAQRYFESIGHIKYKVFECGKGAQYDDINRIMHEIAVVTPIFLEHTRELGNTIEEIAEDKAEIVTDSVRALVSGMQIDSVSGILKEKCKKNNTLFFELGKDFFVSSVCMKNGRTTFTFHAERPAIISLRNIEIPLLGTFQAENAATAIETYLVNHILNAFVEKDFLLDEEELEKYFNELFSNVSCPGRIEIFRKDPIVIIDNTINRISAEEIYKIITSLTKEKFHLVLSIPNDKDFLGVVKVLKDITGKISIMPLKNPHYRIDPVVEKQEIDRAIDDIDVDIIDESDIKNLLDNEHDPILFSGATAMVKEVHEILSS